MSAIRNVVWNRWSLLLALFVGSVQAAPPPPPSAPLDGALKGLSPAQLNRFTIGKLKFGLEATAATGLGPLFNGRSCNECHPNGSGSAILGHVIGLSGPDQFNAGGPVIQIKALKGFQAEAIPDNIPVATRRSMTNQGLGLVGAIPDNALLAEQASQQNLFPAFAGKANIVTDAVTGDVRVGRVGQKSQHPNATSFTAEASLREMGLTSFAFRDEEAPYNNPSLLPFDPRPGIDDIGGNGLLDIGFFIDCLAPPENNPPSSSSAQTQVNNGAAIFANIGCAVCHKPAWTTGSHNIGALSGKTIYPYSDFLLHDMGASGDGVQQGTDSNGQPIPGSWMRTTPLWGLRLNSTLWHDGSLNQGDYTGAINKHDGQGAASKAAFNGLSSSQKQALLAFLGSL
jgi:CxxC motif-containing protein (DUF1111 family)